MACVSLESAPCVLPFDYMPSAGKATHFTACASIADFPPLSVADRSYALNASMESSQWCPTLSGTYTMKKPSKVRDWALCSCASPTSPPTTATTAQTSAPSADALSSDIKTWAIVVLLLVVVCCCVPLARRLRRQRQERYERISGLQEHARTFDDIALENDFDTN